MTERNPSSPADRRKNLARIKSDRRKADTGVKNQGGPKPDRSAAKPDTPPSR
jgi:hypothetical protein